MKWTNEKPTKEGYYWYKTSKERNPFIVYAHVIRYDGRYDSHLEVWRDGVPLHIVAGWWSDAPISEPEDAP